MHLSSAAASKVLPANIELIARNIYFYFSHSAKRQIEFRKFQEFFGVDQHKILKCANTRWLSLEQVVSRILEQWVPLQHYFLGEKYDLSSCSNSDLACKIQGELNNNTKFYLMFSKYVLKFTNKLNLEFQAESIRIHLLLSHTKTLHKTLLSNFIKPEFSTSINIDFNNTNCFKELEAIYCGPSAELLLKTEQFTQYEVKELKKTWKKYYVVLCQDISKRINFEDPALLAVQGINPSSLAESTAHIASVFPNLIPEHGIEDLEWRLLKNQEIISKDLEFEEFSLSIFKLKNALNEVMFPKVNELISNLFCLPHSSATAERIFSQLFLIKDKKRNCLSTETVHAIMCCKELIQDSNSILWSPTKRILNVYK